MGDARGLRTTEEIESIARYKGDVIWIENLQSEGLHGLVDALFEHHGSYALNEINSAYFVVLDTHGEFKKELLTTELLDAVTAIAEELYAIYTAEECRKWEPEDYRPLVNYFSSNFHEWELAKQVIRTRRLNRYPQLMELLPTFKESSSTPSLLSGVL